MKSLGARLLATCLVFGLAWCFIHFLLADVFWHRGNESYRQKHYEQAIEQYNRALSWGRPHYLNDPECLYCDRGNAFDMAGRFEHALADYDEAIRLSPGTGRFYVEKAIAYRRSKHYKEAVACLDQALALPNARPHYYVERADSLIALEEFAKAIADLDRYLASPENPPDNARRARAYDLRGWSYFKSADFPKALADYESALKIQPGYALALHDRGELKQAQGDEAGARADYELAKQAGYQD